MWTRKPKRTRWLAWSGSLSLVLSVATALAAAASDIDSPAQGSLDTSAISEVIVTAQKRAENIRDVPISISALSGETLERAQVADYDDLSRTVPGMSFGSGGSEGLTNIEIRGVSSTSGSATIGVYIDDVSVTVTNLFLDGATQPKLVDLSSIEVLRGPQGTLYGASSMGGTVRFLTKAPDLQESSGFVSAQTSDTSHGGLNWGWNGAVNLPLIDDKLAARVSIGYSSDSGYLDNYSLDGPLQHSDVNSERAYTGHLSLLFIPNGTTRVTAALFAQRDKIGDSSVFYPSLGLWKQNKLVPEPGTDDVLVASLKIEQPLGFADLTAITGYFNRRFDRQQDGTYYNSYGFATYFLDPVYPDMADENAATFDNLPSPVHYVSDYITRSEELRLSSPVDGPGWLKWVIGGYVSDQSSSNLNFQTIPGINAAFQHLYGIPMEQSLLESTYAAPGVVLFPDDNDGTQMYRLNERQYAAFGQVDYLPVSRLHLSFGARYASQHYDYRYSAYGFYLLGVPTPYENSNRFTEVAPKYGVAFDLNSKTNLYASATKGFRFGGPVAPLPFGPTSLCATDFANIGVTSRPQAYKTDTLWSYETGIKSSLLDSRLNINAAAYDIEWKGIQQLIYLPICGDYYTSNVGDARSSGMDIEIRYRPVDSVTLGFNGSYDHAVITRTNNPGAADVGEWILNTPNRTAAASLDYNLPLLRTFNALLHVDVDYTGESRGSYQVANSNYYNPSYTVANLVLSARFGQWDASLFAKNLGNNRTIIQRPQINSLVEGYTVRPLTVGASLRVAF